MKKLLIFLFFLLIISMTYLWFQDKTPAQHEVLNPISTTTKPLIIVLSPHFDDGVLSLGGLMAKREHELLVMTFFTQRPTIVMHTNWDRISGFSNSDEEIFTRTKENENALLPFNTIIKNFDYLDFQYRKENQDKEIKNKIIEDIKSVIATYKDRKLFIYGPGIFGKKITHPDHKIVHDAFMDVLKMNTRSDIQFFVYEDFPYIRQFQTSGLGNFNDYLKRQENIKFEEKSIELNKLELEEKISSIYTYKSQIKAFLSFDDDLGVISEKFNKVRCKTSQPTFYACEVVHNFSN